MTNRDRREKIFIVLGILLGLIYIPVIYADTLITGLIIVLTPPPPTNLNAYPVSVSELNLSWTDTSLNEDGFEIERKIGSGGSYIVIATTSANIATYSDTGLSPATTYYYQVRAFNSDGYSAYSNEASGTTNSPSGGSGNTGGGGGGGGGSGYTPYLAAAVVFEGKAYPGSNITVLKDAQVAATTKAGPDAIFKINLSSLSPGSYTFGIWAEDNKGNKSAVHNFTLSVTGGATNVISGIFLPPTIAIDKTEVKKGDILTILGQSAPQAQISVFINSDTEILKKTVSDSNGIWLYKFDTSEIDFGDHMTRARSTKENEISIYSNTLPFKVGLKNVLSEPAKKCPTKGDLNGDCRVNLIDFSIAAYWWKRSLTETAKNSIDAKLFADGKIDLRDFSIMAYYWTG